VKATVAPSGEKTGEQSDCRLPGEVSGRAVKSEKRRCKTCIAANASSAESVPPRCR
jgi:hypothetical protein